MLLSSSNRKYPPFPLLSYFSAVVCLKCLLHHVLLFIAYTFRENREFVFIITVQFMMSAKIRMRFGLIVFVYLYAAPSHYHHCANLSEDIELIKCLSDIFFEYVSNIKRILPVVRYTICGAVCFQFTHFPCDDWENIYTLSYHHQIGSMNYCPLFRVRSCNNGVHCIYFCILIPKQVNSAFIILDLIFCLFNIGNYLLWYFYKLFHTLSLVPMAVMLFQIDIFMWLSQNHTDNKSKFVYVRSHNLGLWFLVLAKCYIYFDWVSLCPTQHRPWTSCQIRKITCCACAGNAGNVFPATAD